MRGLLHQAEHTGGRLTWQRGRRRRRRLHYRIAAPTAATATAEVAATPEIGSDREGHLSQNGYGVNCNFGNGLHKLACDVQKKYNHVTVCIYRYQAPSNLQPPPPNAQPPPNKLLTMHGRAVTSHDETIATNRWPTCGALHKLACEVNVGM